MLADKEVEFPIKTSTLGIVSLKVKSVVFMLTAYAQSALRIIKPSDAARTGYLKLSFLPSRSDYLEHCLALKRLLPCVHNHHS
jgi:hypothetical protein